jgi:predicted ATPase
MYLADLHSRNQQAWTGLKALLEGFGKASGLFDEISIKRLGNRDSEPFQIQIRKFGGGRKGPQRNLIDVGYGVSQVLPVITELLREGAPDMFLLQQPEVHLHPSAQAALGGLFCQVAGPERQLVIETHSDHLINRVRMDVRDGNSPLSPDDVSILYFEREDLDVKIHSLRIDEEGNILGAPGSYGRFFMEETARSLGL